MRAVELIDRHRSRGILETGALSVCLSLFASCNRKPERPKATYVPIAQIERSYGRLVATANMPTPDQNGTGDHLGLFRDDAGTVWGIPLMYDEGGNLLGCAPSMLREARVTDTIPAGELEIVGASNEPSGWRGGTGKLELLFRDGHGAFHRQSVASGELKNGPVCWSQSPPVQPLPYYRLIRGDSK